MRRIKVVKVSKPRTPFMVAVPASKTGTKRVRRYFKEQTEALAYVVALKQQGFLSAEGQANRSSLSLGPSVSDCAALWIARHQQARLGYSQIKIVLGRLAARFGKDPIESVTHRELDAWLRSLENFSPIYQHNHWRIVRRFFSFCQDYLEVIPRNPMRKLQEPRLEHVDPAILTPEQMRICLEAANVLDENNGCLIAYLTLGGFAGLRTEEILRQRWEDIDWQSSEIYVRQSKRVRGWRPRHVEILPALRRHLEHLALKEDRIFDTRRSLYLLRRALVKKLGWSEWPSNCLRHSFKTYHAAHFQDLPRTQLQMGHAGIGMTNYIYGSPATRANAAAWWEL